MSLSQAASVTYRRGKRFQRTPKCAREKPARPGSLWDDPKFAGYALPPHSVRPPGPFVLPRPTNPDGDIEAFRAEINAKYPDSPESTMTEEEYCAIFQRHTARPIFRDS